MNLFSKQFNTMLVTEYIVCGTYISTTTQINRITKKDLETVHGTL